MFEIAPVRVPWLPTTTSTSWPSARLARSLSATGISTWTVSMRSTSAKWSSGESASPAFGTVREFTTKSYGADMTSPLV